MRGPPYQEYLADDIIPFDIGASDIAASHRDSDGHAGRWFFSGILPGRFGRWSELAKHGLIGRCAIIHESDDIPGRQVSPAYAPMPNAWKRQVPLGASHKDVAGLPQAMAAMCLEDNEE